AKCLASVSTLMLIHLMRDATACEQKEGKRRHYCCRVGLFQPHAAALRPESVEAVAVEQTSSRLQASLHTEGHRGAVTSSDAAFAIRRGLMEKMELPEMRVEPAQTYCFYYWWRIIKLTL
uniref:Uncharacterized protein n=1 Tax=Takifugu rubripes TaxID=31033 RepID=A0A674MLZ0_TAKRU